MNIFKLGLIAIICVLALAPTVKASDKVDIGYDDGLFIKTDDGNYLLKTNIQIQPQYQFLSIEGQGKTNTFQIRRGRLIFSGNAFTPDLTFKFQFEAVGGRASTANDSGATARGPNLRDAWINYAVNDGFQIKAGQFKPYFNFEELTSAASLQFVDKGLANETFSFNRDLGVALHGKVLDKILEWAVYATNEGSNRNTVNPNNELLIGGRLVYAILGKNKYTQSDVKHSEDPNLAIGVAANWTRLSGAPDVSQTATTFDINARYLGFSALAAAYFFRNHTVATNTFGFSGQIGYFIIPEKFEASLRFASVIPRGAVTNGYEAGAALGYFFKGHRLKLQADYNVLMNSALALNASTGPGRVSSAAAPGFVQNQNDHRARLQAQLYF